MRGGAAPRQSIRLSNIHLPVYLGKMLKCLQIFLSYFNSAKIFQSTDNFCRCTTRPRSIITIMTNKCKYFTKHKTYLKEKNQTNVIDFKDVVTISWKFVAECRLHIWRHIAIITPSITGLGWSLVTGHVVTRLALLLHIFYSVLAHFWTNFPPQRSQNNRQRGMFCWSIL